MTELEKLKSDYESALEAADAAYTAAAEAAEATYVAYVAGGGDEGSARVEYAAYVTALNSASYAYHD